MKKTGLKSGQKEKVACILKIYGASRMTRKGRSNVAEFIRTCANDLESEGRNYSDILISSYRYMEKKNGKN